MTCTGNGFILQDVFVLYTWENAEQMYLYSDGDFHCSAKEMLKLSAVLYSSSPDLQTVSVLTKCMMLSEGMQRKKLARNPCVAVKLSIHWDHKQHYIHLHFSILIMAYS